MLNSPTTMCNIATNTRSTTEVPDKQQMSNLAHSLCPYSSPIVTLVVGGPNSPAAELSPTRFHIHEAFLHGCSPVFRSMLTPFVSTEFSDRGEECLQKRQGYTVPWLEARTRTISLPEDRIADWEMLSKWLYCQSTPTRYKANCLTAATLHTCDGQDLLNCMVQGQPGLRHDDVNNAVQQYLDWLPKRKRCAATSTRQSSLAEEQEVDDIETKVQHHIDSRPASDGSVHFTFSTSSLAQYHEGNIDQRPLPPALGPLIRLYILADKYIIAESNSSTSSMTMTYSTERSSTRSDDLIDVEEQSLKSQIALRLRAINKLAKVVPDKDDIDRLWSNVVLESHLDPLKTAILEMFARLSLSSLRRVFSQDNGEWHAGFLRDLLMWKVAKPE